MAIPDALRAFIASARWQFASTMKAIPHEYTMREWHRKAGTEDAYDQMIEAIQEHGYDEKFGTKPDARVFRYLEVDGWRYWTMPGQSGGINRAEVGDNGKPKYGPLWLTGRKRETPGNCCALGRATGGKHHAATCPKAVITLDV